MQGPPPEDARTLLLSPLASHEAPCFVPFWRVDLGASSRSWVCAVDGQLLASTLPAHERRANVRAVSKLALLIMAAGYFGFITAQLAAVAAMVMPTTTPMHLMMHTPVVIGLLFGYAVTFRRLIAPALDEVALERLDPLLLSGPGPAFTRAIRALGLVLVLGAALSLWGVEAWSHEEVTLILLWVDFALASLFGVLAFVATWRPRTYTPTPEVLSHTDAETWLRLSKGLSELLLWGAVAVTLNAVFSALGAYLLPVMAGGSGPAWEANAIEAKFVAVAMLIALVRAPLPFESRVTLFVAQAIPLVFEGTLGPGLTATLQLGGVFAAAQLVRHFEGDEVRFDAAALARALRVEGAILFGSLLGQLGGILLVGTSGSTLGDVVGELVAGALMLQWLAIREADVNPS